MHSINMKGRYTGRPNRLHVRTTTCLLGDNLLRQWASSFRNRAKSLGPESIEGVGLGGAWACSLHAYEPSEAARCACCCTGPAPPTGGCWGTTMRWHVWHACGTLPPGQFHHKVVRHPPMGWTALAHFLSRRPFPLGASVVGPHPLSGKAGPGKCFCAGGSMKITVMT